jgi:hypothetical protein
MARFGKNKFLTILTIFLCLGYTHPTPRRQGRFAKRFSRRAGRRRLRPAYRMRVSELRANGGYGPAIGSHTSGTMTRRRSNPVGRRTSATQKGRRSANRERTCIAWNPAAAGTPSSWRPFFQTGLPLSGDRRPGPLSMHTPAKAREGAGVSI